MLELEVDKVGDIRAQGELAKAIRTVVAAKQAGNEDFLADLVAEAVLAVLPKNAYNFNVDNIRVVKIMGGAMEQSRVVKGMVFGREPDGTIKKASRAKVGVYSCPIDISQTETKGTVLLHNAKEMLDFTKGEESQLEQIVKELHDSGLRVVVAGTTVGELAMHTLTDMASLSSRFCRSLSSDACAEWLVQHRSHVSGHQCLTRWVLSMLWRRWRLAAIVLQYSDRRTTSQEQPQSSFAVPRKITWTMSNVQWTTVSTL